MDTMNKNQFEKLSDAQWEALKELFPHPPKRSRGKPHTPWRYVLNSILYVLFRKAKWGDWPQELEYASKSAAHRWFLIWDKSGLMQQTLEIVQASQTDLEIFHPQRRVHPIKEADEEAAEELLAPLYIEAIPSTPAQAYHP